MFRYVKVTSDRVTIVDNKTELTAWLSMMDLYVQVCKGNI